MKPAKIIHTVKDAGLAIEVRAYSDGRYGFALLEDGQRRMVLCKRREDAIRKAQEHVKGKGKLDLLKIDPAEFEEFLRWKAQRKSSPPIPQMVTDFLASRKEKGRSFSRMRELRETLMEFSERFTGTLGEIQRAEYEAWLGARNVGAVRWNKRRSIVTSFCRWARAGGFINSELTIVEQVDKRKEDAQPVSTYSPEELIELLRHTKPDFIPLVVLGAFCGIRTEELAPDPAGGKQGLLWENVLWEKAKIDLPANVSKVGRRRFIPLCDAALAFLAPWRQAVGRCVPMVRVDARSFVTRRDLWKTNALRHSYASYRLALTENVGQLALELGNSPGIIHQHYLDLKHREEAEAYFAIRPESLLDATKTGPIACEVA